MTFKHLIQGTQAFERHVEELEKHYNAMKKQLEITRQDNEMLRRLCRDQCKDKGFKVISGGLDQDAINRMLFGE